MLFILTFVATVHQWLPVISNLFQLATNGMSKSMSRPNTAAPGEARLWVLYDRYCEWPMLHCLKRHRHHRGKRNRPYLIPRCVTFVRGLDVFSTVVGLHCIPYESHRCSKCNLNSDPLSCINFWHRGYLHNHMDTYTTSFFTNFATLSELLSKISSTEVAPCHWL